ncbi:hypothetical protein [Polaribacter sp. Hel_I_88]|uniref:hypothetical protein n=1 Tax=Polaribacter sp. Hel_I_88 TaxID=1250006 RepID=UPI000B2B36CD|nr:hypothetical protein [Polaribacter sp. Hel_I_88]
MTNSELSKRIKETMQKAMNCIESKEYKKGIILNRKAKILLNIQSMRISKESKKYQNI